MEEVYGGSNHAKEPVTGGSNHELQTQREEQLRAALKEPIMLSTQDRGEPQEYASRDKTQDNPAEKRRHIKTKIAEVTMKDLASP